MIAILHCPRNPLHSKFGAPGSVLQSEEIFRLRNREGTYTTSAHGRPEQYECMDGDCLFLPQAPVKVEIILQNSSLQR